MKAIVQEKINHYPKPPKMMQPQTDIRTQTSTPSAANVGFCGVSLHIISGFIAALGAVAVATAFIALSASSFGIPVMAVGIGMIVAGGITFFTTKLNQNNTLQPDGTTNQPIV